MNMARICNEAVYRNNQMMMIMNYKIEKKEGNSIIRVCHYLLAAVCEQNDV